jgi:hypothetical protein
LSTEQAVDDTSNTLGETRRRGGTRGGSQEIAASRASL